MENKSSNLVLTFKTIVVELKYLDRRQNLIMDFYKCKCIFIFYYCYYNTLSFFIISFMVLLCLLPTCTSRCDWSFDCAVVFWNFYSFLYLQLLATANLKVLLCARTFISEQFSFNFLFILFKVLSVKYLFILIIYLFI